MTISANEVSPNQPDAHAWENEGGSITPKPPSSLPEGVTAVESIQYRVGNYSYSKLEDALAEHKRQASKSTT